MPKPLVVARLVLAGAAALMVYGCPGSNNSSSSESSQSNVRSFNTLISPSGSTGTLSFNTSASGSAYASGVTYGNFSPASGYTTVTNSTFTPVASGNDVTSIQQTSPNTLNGGYYTVVALGQVGTTGSTAPHLVIIPNLDQSHGAIPSGQAAVRFINLSPGSGQLSLYNITNPTTSTPFNTSLTNIGFGYSALSNLYQFVGAGTYTLSVRSSADTNADLPLASTTLNNVTFEAGKAYTVWVLGQQGNTNQPLRTVVTTDYPPAG